MSSEAARSRVNWPVLAVGLALVGLLVAILASGFGKDPREIKSVMVSRPAPDFALETLDGEPVSLASLRGTPIVLNFWSTWCGPCKIEHPLLQEAARAYPEVKFLGLLYSDDADKARRFLQQQGFAYPTLADPTNRAAIAYGVTGVPETYFIDRQGTILFKVAAPVTADMLAEWIPKIAGSKP